MVGSPGSRGEVGALKLAMVVHRVTSSRDETTAGIVSLVERAARGGAGLVLAAEASLTGLINDDDPARDLSLGETVPGPFVDGLTVLARRYGIYLGAGLLEREGGCLYDTAVLLGPHGDLVLKYRRISPGWHGRGADPAVYPPGEDIGTCRTPLGETAFLLCGDLFDDELVDRVRQRAVDGLLVPMARCFGDGAWDQARWDAEAPGYVERAVRSGALTLVVNYLASIDLDGYGAFGGALAGRLCARGHAGGKDRGVVGGSWLVTSSSWGGRESGGWKSAVGPVASCVRQGWGLCWRICGRSVETCRRGYLGFGRLRVAGVHHYRPGLGPVGHLADRGKLDGPPLDRGRAAH